MNALKVVVTHLLLLASVVSAMAPGQAGWLCFDQDGSVSWEDHSARAECCAKHEHPESRGETPCVHGSDDPCCTDIAVQADTSGTAQAKAADVAPVLVAISVPQLSLDLPVLDAPPIREHYNQFPLDSPTLSSLKTIILLV